MRSYTTFTDFASVQPAWMPGEMIEEAYGAHAAKAGNVQRNGAGWMILDGTFRYATDLESAAIDAKLVEIAEAVAYFGGDLDGYSDAVAARADDRDWHDTVASIRFGFQMM